MNRWLFLFVIVQVGWSPLAFAEGVKTRLCYDYVFKDNRFIDATNTLSRVSSKAQLELVGRWVVQLILSERLYKDDLRATLGLLSQRLDNLLQASSITQVATELQIMPPGTHPRLLGSALYVSVGILYSDFGFEATRSIVERWFERMLLAAESIASFKSQLQIRVQRDFSSPPTYSLVKLTGPKHNRRFQVDVIVDGRPLATGYGSTRKMAEQDAARKALSLKQYMINDSVGGQSDRS